MHGDREIWMCFGLVSNQAAADCHHATDLHPSPPDHCFGWSKKMNEPMNCVILLLAAASAHAQSKLDVGAETAELHHVCHAVCQGLLHHASDHRDRPDLDLRRLGVLNHTCS